MAKTRSRKIRENRRHLSVWGIIVIVLAVLSVSTIGGLQLKQKNRAYQEREEALMAEIEKEKARSEEIEEFKAYTQTKKWVEEMARNLLNLVHEDEILFKASDK